MMNWSNFQSWSENITVNIQGGDWYQEGKKDTKGKFQIKKQFVNLKRFLIAL